MPLCILLWLPQILIGIATEVVLRDEYNIIRIACLLAISIRKPYWSGGDKFNIRWVGKSSTHAHGLWWANDDVLGSKCVRAAVSVKNQTGNRWHRITCLHANSVRWVLGVFFYYSGWTQFSRSWINFYIKLEFSKRRNTFFFYHASWWNYPVYCSERRPFNFPVLFHLKENSHRLFHTIRTFWLMTVNRLNPRDSGVSV